MGAPRSASLAEFAKENPSRTSGLCWLCSLPEREEVEAYVAANGNTWKVIARWLVSKGHKEATAPRVQYHFLHGFRTRENGK